MDNYGKYELQNAVKKDKDRYLKEIKRRDFEHVVIYGAGRMAKPLYLYLKSQDIAVEAFCVTDKSVNKSEEYGVPIMVIDELNFEQENTLILFGVTPRLNKEVKEIVEKYGYRHYVESTEYIRYYGEYQYEFYMRPVLEITTKVGCVVNCKYCPQELFIKNYFKTGREAKMLSFDVFKKCIDKTPMNTIIEFAGFVEPFLNPECRRMILYANETGRTVSLFTTLRGCNIEDIHAIKNVNYGEFVLHVPDVEGYADIPITKEYLEMLDVVAKARKSNGRKLIDYACSQGEVPDIIKECLGGEVSISVLLHDRAGNLEDEKLFHTRNIGGRIRCELSQTINHNIMLPDGRVVLCTQDYGMTHVFGNLYEQSYEEVINSAEAVRIKQCMRCSEGDSILCRNCHAAIQY